MDGILLTLLLFVSTHPKFEPLEKVEVNHYSVSGVYHVQVLYWERVDGELRVVDWSRLGSIRFRKSGGRWLIFCPKVTLIAKEFTETWTEHDPEAEDRRLGNSHRRRLYR